jgi:hypothetical protein
LIGHTPYIAHHDIESLIGVSEPRSRSLGWVDTDPHAEPIAGPVNKARDAFPSCAGHASSMDRGRTVLDSPGPGSPFHPSPLDLKPFCPCAALK